MNSPLIIAILSIACGGCLSLAGFIAVQTVANGKASAEIRTALIGLAEGGGLLGEMAVMRRFKHETGNRLLSLELGKMDKPGFSSHEEHIATS